MNQLLTDLDAWFHSKGPYHPEKLKASIHAELVARGLRPAEEDKGISK